MSDRQIHISRGGEKYGPYPEANAKEMLAAGQLQPTDLAWYPGADDWKPLKDLFEADSPPPVPADPVAEPPDEEPDDPDKIHVTRKGEPIGPYSRDKAREYFIAGQLLPTDWGWHDGMGDWKPINEVLGMEAPAQTTAAASSLAQSTVPAGSKETSLNPHAIDCFACGMMVVVIIFAHRASVFTSIVTVNIDPKIPIILAWVLVVVWFLCRSSLVKDSFSLGNDFGERGTFEFIFKVYSIFCISKREGPLLGCVFRLQVGERCFYSFYQYGRLNYFFYG